MINAGGSLGMWHKGNVVLAPENGAEFVSPFPGIGDLGEVLYVQLFALDGVNVQPNHWSSLARYIYDRREEFDGFVVAHGTDTMSYSASATHDFYNLMVALALSALLGYQATNDFSRIRVYGRYLHAEVASAPTREMIGILLRIRRVRLVNRRPMCATDSRLGDSGAAPTHILGSAAGIRNVSRYLHRPCRRAVRAVFGLRSQREDAEDVGASTGPRQPARSRSSARLVRQRAPEEVFPARNSPRMRQRAPI